MIRPLVLEQPRHGLGRHRAEAHPHPVPLDLDQRLDPDHAARAVADQRQGLAPARGLGADRLGHRIGAERAGGGVAGHPDPHHARPPASASSPAAVARPTSRSSNCAAGPQAQRPRQNTGSSVSAPSPEVWCQSSPSATRS